MCHRKSSLGKLAANKRAAKNWIFFSGSKSWWIIGRGGRKENPRMLYGLGTCVLNAAQCNLTGMLKTC